MSGLRLSTIVPASDGPPTLPRCVAAIEAAAAAHEELLVVEEPRGIGPARARNAAARRATGDVLVFVDADVVVRPDAFERIRAAFSADPGLVAVFGAYDDEPEAPGLVSRFRNLLHHHVHAAAGGPAETFWAGLGAVRADAFHAAGGFDGDGFHRPSIEDVELGARLRRAGGRIVLDPTIRGTHLKRWTLRSMLVTDVHQREAPVRSSSRSTAGCRRAC
ncbi:MAG: glycosyltransferase [Thermoleophilia bacterium]